jgi:hypothetical protein
MITKHSLATAGFVALCVLVFTFFFLVTFWMATS